MLFFPTILAEFNFISRIKYNSDEISIIVFVGLIDLHGKKLDSFSSAECVNLKSELGTRTNHPDTSITPSLKTLAQTNLNKQTPTRNSIESKKRLFIQIFQFFFVRFLKGTSLLSPFDDGMRFEVLVFSLFAFLLHHKPTDPYHYNFRWFLYDNNNKHRIFFTQIKFGKKWKVVFF